MKHFLPINNSCLTLKEEDVKKITDIASFPEEGAYFIKHLIYKLQVLNKNLGERI